MATSKTAKAAMITSRPSAHGVRARRVLSILSRRKTGMTMQQICEKMNAQGALYRLLLSMRDAKQITRENVDGIFVYHARKK